MSDRDLRRVPGIGPKSLVELRAGLGGRSTGGVIPPESRRLWQDIAKYLRKALEHRYLRERNRVLRDHRADRVLSSLPWL